MKVFCNIFCEFQWNSTIYPTRRFLELRIQVKTYDRKYTKNNSIYNASGCTFLARPNNGTGPLISILLRLIFMLALFCNFAWWPKIFSIILWPQISDMDCFSNVPIQTLAPVIWIIIRITIPYIISFNCHALDSFPCGFSYFNTRPIFIILISCCFRFMIFVAKLSPAQSSSDWR